MVPRDLTVRYPRKKSGKRPIDMAATYTCTPQLDACARSCDAAVGPLYRQARNNMSCNSSACTS
jgi:hypothetical protein